MSSLIKRRTQGPIVKTNKKRTVNWTEKEQGNQQRKVIENNRRQVQAKKEREEKQFVKMVEDSKYLNKWDDFRARRDAAIWKYYRVKRKRINGAKWARQIKTVLVLAEQYFRMRRKLDKTIELIRLRWILFCIVSKLKKKLRKQFSGMGV